MRLLDRYLLREFLLALLVCFGAFLMLWVTFDLLFELHKLQENHLRVGDIVEFYVFQIPEFIPIALPISLLLALLYALTNHARYNEITAIRAAGVSLARICLPYLIVAVLFNIGLFALYEFLGPPTSDKTEQELSPRPPRE